MSVNKQLHRLETICDALGNECRLKIMHILVRHQQRVIYTERGLAEAIGLTAHLTRYHLEKLVQLQLVEKIRTTSPNTYELSKEIVWSDFIRDLVDYLRIDILLDNGEDSD